MITEADIQKELAAERERQKGKHLKTCDAGCGGLGTFCGRTCECCGGTGQVDYIGMWMLGWEMAYRREVQFLNAFIAEPPDEPVEVAAE